MTDHPAIATDILAGLDAEQRQAATTLNGPLCILAGAGTGKTRAITHRIAHGVQTGVYDPHRTLALTFTARAAAEMRTRLRDLGTHGVQARTFHSAALRQLQYFWPQAVGGAVPELVDHKVNMLAEAARRLRTTTDRAALRDLAGEIEWAKVSMRTPDSYAAAAAGREMPTGWDANGVARLFQGYEDVKTDRNLIDFEDVLLIMVGILETEPKIAAQVRDQYRVFIVDEYQDVSPLQHRLLDLWRGGRSELCVVGDASQTIYSFTGATSRFLLDFRQEHPDATMVKLVRDYRSTPEIVDLANRLLSERTRQRVPVPGPDGVRGPMPRWAEPLELVSQRDHGPAPVFAECSDDEAEAGWIAAQVKQLLDEGIQAAEIAVLFRTNGQSQAFESAFAAAGIGYQLRGGERFFSRREIRDGILQLRAAARSAQDVSGDQVPGRVKDVLASLGYTEAAPQASGATREKWESLNALVALSEELATTRGDQFTLTDLVAELDERAASQHAPTVQGVTLASLHSAKGLEWDAVFLVGLSEGLMPISFADTQEDIDEERRLLYVGITRARLRLFLTWTLSRGTGGRSTRKPSRFLDSLDPEADSRHGAQGQGRRRPGTAGASGSGGRGSGRKRAQPAQCRSCGTLLETGAERKTGRCLDCPPTYDEGLFENLKAWRLSTSQAASMPAFVVFTDATLVAIAEAAPKTPAELLRIAGVGKSKLEKYGEDVLELVNGTPTA
ncbi:ATP-dependent DNA helicase UvrD2 [Citricoccus nitrophenolicus]|uniref:DNA 3'-5' helicase n=1 Tax=Citricoccus muralis TaxID=169134 RepID=A0A3D9LB67_9MICC|nr:ATP-dependent DNA helicase UvrD2 [Citricoccus muralis]REE03505.1 Rep family ATP-dependent DNA helicase [Citricoccus muralis]